MADNKDYVPHGSARHAAILGLIPDKDNPLGYRLADMTAFGPQASPSYMEEVLRQKVSELKAGPPPVPQASDPNKPNYAHPLWLPEEPRAGV